jgi:hypothetical protein
MIRYEVQIYFAPIKKTIKNRAKNARFELFGKVYGL